MLDAPLWKPPSPRWRGNPGRTPRRFAAGASVPLGKAASACALASAAAPPPLRVGGLRPLAPRVPRWGTSAGHARLLGASPPCPRVLADVSLSPAFPVRKSPPIMRERAWDRVRNGFAGNAFANLPEAPAAKRLGVPSLPSRELRPKAAPARPQGESQRGRSPLWPVFAYFLLARK